MVYFLRTEQMFVTLMLERAVMLRIVASELIFEMGHLVWIACQLPFLCCLNQKEQERGFVSSGVFLFCSLQHEHHQVHPSLVLLQNDHHCLAFDVHSNRKCVLVINFIFKTTCNNLGPFCKMTITSSSSFI